MIKVLITTFVLIIQLTHANEVTLEWLKDKPRTYAKDFYIWQYLKQDISPANAIKALGQANNVNNRLFYAYAKKLKHDETTAVVQCLRAKTSTLINTNASCMELGLSIYDITKLTTAQLEQASKTLQNKYPKKNKAIKIIGATIPFTKLISSDTQTFFQVFNNTGSKFRTQYFNYKIPLKTLSRISKHKKFNQTIKLIVTNNKLLQAQKSLFNIDDTSLSHLSSFLLAINALKHDKLDVSEKYFNSAHKKAYYQFDKDKVTFWKYLISKDVSHFYKLSKSWDLNMYSLYAKEYFGMEIKNILYDIKNDAPNLVYEKQDVSDPFFWIPILNDLKKLDENKMFDFSNLLNNIETLPHLAFISERYNNYRKSYFITPFDSYLNKYGKERQALMNAIARQESRFIPSSISTAYAMGVMQIMPFLSKAIAKQLDEDYEITDQLKADVNLKYANFHLNYLVGKMKHPLLVAYAYNGGIGFTRKMLKSGLFNKDSKYKDYEPFLSMELLPYNETRKYGKKVLANYYMYKNHIDKENPVKIKALLESLTQ